MQTVVLVALLTVPNLGKCLVEVAAEIIKIIGEERRYKMSRLIDADELKKVLDGYYYPEYGKPNFDLDFLLNEVIEKQPTAYDLDKVVRELEEKEEKYMNNSEKAAELGVAYEKHMIFNGAKGNAFEEAIEIVKRGGAYD